MRKLTHEEQVAIIANVNPNIEVLGKIIDNSTPVLCRCEICDHEWFVRPNHLKQGYGCPECGKLKKAQSKTLSYEEQAVSITKANPCIEILGRIVDNKTPVLCKCKVCGCRWPIRPNDLKRGRGCPECSKLRIAKSNTLSHEEQIEAITKINHDIEILGEITGDKVKVPCLCNICGYVWLATPNKIKRGNGCPRCANYGFKNGKESCLYLLVDDLELPTCIKIGVTNDFNRRLDELTHHTPFPVHVLKVFTFEAGCATSQLEQFAHTIFADRNCHFEGFDGCTEWFWYSHEIVDFLEENC